MLHRCDVQRSLVFCALALGALPLLAHSKPKSMVPAADATVSSPPELSVFFTEPLEPKFSSLNLTDEKGAPISNAKSVVDSSDQKHMTLALPRLAPGIYHVHWVTAATDGHRMDGSYSFKVK